MVERTAEEIRAYFGVVEEGDIVSKNELLDQEEVTWPKEHSELLWIAEKN